VAQPPEIGAPVAFSIPKRRPKVEQKEAPPDRRKVAVLPIKAVADKRVTDGMFRTLAVLCSYCNRAGITWVSTERMGKDMGVTKQAISKQLVKLQKVGYVQIVRKHSWRSRTATSRVIFDESVTTEDAVALTSAIEDTRPPFMQARDQEIMDIMQDNQRPDITPEEMERNRKRLEVLTKDLKEIAGNMTGIRQRGYTMPADGVTKAVKEARAKVKARARKPIESQPYSQPDKVDSTQPHTVNLGGGIQSTNKVDKKHENIGIERMYKVYENVKNTLIKDSDAKWAQVAVEVGVTESEMVVAMQNTHSLGDACRQVLEAKGY